MSHVLGACLGEQVKADTRNISMSLFAAGVYGYFST